VSAAAARLSPPYLRYAPHGLEPDQGQTSDDGETELEQANDRRHESELYEVGILRPMARRRDDIDRLTELEELFADLWQVPRFAAGLRRAYRPQIDSYRTEDPPELTVVVELPGAEPEAIHITVDGQQLLVYGDRPRPRVAGQFQRSEIEYGAFQRRIALPEDVDPSSARASYERGLLRIVLPLATKPAPSQRFPIEVRRAP
jgi:HSP20 family protein